MSHNPHYSPGIKVIIGLRVLGDQGSDDHDPHCRCEQTASLDEHFDLKHRALHCDVEALLGCVVVHAHAPEIAASIVRPSEDYASEPVAAGVTFVQHFLGKGALLGHVEAYLQWSREEEIFEIVESEQSGYLRKWWDVACTREASYREWR